MRIFTNIQSITRFFRISLTLLVLLLSIEAWSQNYPVTCTPIVKPSYSLKWSEISTSSEMFKVHLLLKDLTKPSVDVYLKIRLSGVGVDIRTVDGFIPSQTLKLIPGQAVLRSGSDLAEYFNISNLVVDGVDISALYAGGRLPEGLYTWTVEAYEVDRNRQVSNTGMALMNVFKNYPPIINIPQDGAILPVTTPQNVLFSWTSRSTASLNAAQGKTYKLRIYPLSGTQPDGNDDPNVVANSGIQPIEITRTTPYFNYGAGNIPLEKGKRYAVQVQELDDTNADEYENEGKSQVVTFSYGKPCVAPEGLVINPIGKGRVELTCEATAEDAETYPITAWYKTQRPETSVWNAVPFNGNSAVISGLKDKTDYEFKLSSACGDNTSTMAPLREPVIFPSGDPSTEPVPFTIDDSAFDEEEPEVLDPIILDPYTIGIEINADGTTRPVETVNEVLTKIIKPVCVNNFDAYESCSPNHPAAQIPTGTIPLASLAIGDVLGIYDYAVLVTEVSRGTALAGKGLVKLPFLDNAFMAVEFEGIKAWKTDDPNAKGGCVYDVPENGFHTRPINQKDLENEKVDAVSKIIKLTDPTVFHGNLDKAVKEYVRLTTPPTTTPTTQQRQDLGVIAKGISVATSNWKDKFTEAFSAGGVPHDSNPKIKEIMDEMDGIINQLNTDIPNIKNGPSYPIIPNLKAKIDAIIEKIKALKQENTPKPPRIQNVLATNISYNDATLTWQGDPRFTKYVISYKTADGGELIETVNSNRLDLKKLQENSQYGFKIEGYVGDEVVDTYENGAFKTLDNSIKPPQNIKPVYLTDNTVKITWDKDTQHENYALVYRTSSGIEKKVYPTSNEITLLDIDPTEKYSFDVTAFSIAKQNATASGAFSSGEQCKFSLTANKEVINAGETVELTNICMGTVSWSNNTSSDKTISVSPTTTTTYISACTVTVSGKTYTCSAPVKITVQPAICQNFTVSKTIIKSPMTGALTFRYGDGIKLTANGCAGEVQWQNIAENYIKDGNTVTFYPQTSGTYKAVCSTSGCWTFETLTMPCQVSLATELTGNQTFKATASCTFGRLKISISDNPEFWHDHGRGPHEWLFEGNSGSYLYGPDNKKSWKPRGEVTATAACLGDDGNVLCSQEVVYPSTANKCEKFKIIPTEQPNGKILLSLEGCSAGGGTVYIRKQGSPASYSTTLQIFTPTVPTVYEAYCPNKCFTTLTVEPKKGPSPEVWFVRAGKAMIYQNKINGELLSVGSLTASCANGESISWVVPIPYDENTTECNSITPPCIASEIVPKDKNVLFPAGETYTVNCTSAEGVTKSINFKIPITSSKCLEFVDVPESITMGQSVPLKVAYCVGNVTWTKEVAKIGGYEAAIDLGTGLSVSDSPVKDTRYTATCDGMPNCSESIIVQVKPCKLNTQFLVNNEAIKESSGYFNNNGDPVVTNLVKMGTEIVATATGCEAGSVEWNFDNQTIIGNPINIKPYKTTTYTATCKLNENILCSSTPFTISIDKMPPAPLEECPELTLSGPSSIVRCQENKVRIDAKGCPNGSFYTWNIKGEGNPITTTNDFFNVTLSAAKTIECSCTAYGKTSSAEIEILLSEPKPSVEETTVYAGVKQFLYAKGCPSSDCKGDGKYSWYKNGLLIGTGKTLQIQIIENTTYQLQCNDGEKVNIPITKKDASGCGGNGLNQPLTFQGTTYLWAEKCDNNYPISWYKLDWRTGQYIYQDENKKFLQVSLPDQSVSIIDLYKVYCTSNNTPCSYDRKISISSSGGSSGLDIKISFQEYADKNGGNQTNPDPCNNYAYAKVNRTTNIGIDDNPFITRSGCPGILYVKGDGLDFSVKGDQVFQLTANKSATYILTCDLKGDGKNVCDWGQLKVKYKATKARESEDTDTQTNASGRAEFLTATQSCTFTAGNAASGVIAQALCQGVNVWKVDGVINQAKVEEYLQTLVTATIAQMATQGITVSISDDKIATAVAAIMSSGEDCSKLAEIANTLTEGNDNIIETDKFNEGVLPEYGKVLEAVTPKPPTLTAITITPASCGLNNGSVKLSATGGTPPYQYSKDGTTFQSTDTFEALAVGKHTFYVKDSKGEKATTTVEFTASIQISRGPILANARENTVAGELGKFTVYSGKGTSKEVEFIAGILGTRSGNDVKIESLPPNIPAIWNNRTYTAVFNNNSPYQFLGYYDFNYANSGGKCTQTGVEDVSGGNCKVACLEAFLPDYIYDANNTPLVQSFIQKYAANKSNPKYAEALLLIKKLEPLGLVKQPVAFAGLTLDQILLALNTTNDALNDNLTKLKQLIATGDRCTLLETLWALNRTNPNGAALKSLPLADRKTAILRLAQGDLTKSNIDIFWCNVGLNGGEESLVKLIDTTPEGNDTYQILKMLSNDDFENKKLISVFYEKMGDVTGSNFTDYITVLTKKYNSLSESQQKDALFSSIVTTPVNLKNRLFQISKFTVSQANSSISDIKILNNGKISFKRTTTTYTGNYTVKTIGGPTGGATTYEPETTTTTETVELAPYDMVQFTGYKNYSIFSNDIEGENKKYPAIYLAYLAQKQNINQSLLALQVAGFATGSGATIELAAGGYMALASISAFSTAGQLADLSLIQTELIPEESAMASFINMYNGVFGILELGNMGATAAALENTLKLTKTLETIDQTEAAIRFDNFIVAFEALKDFNKTVDAKYEKLYKWCKIQRLNFVKEPSSMAFSSVFAFDGLYYKIFNDARLLNKLQALDIKQVEIFFNKIKDLNLSADAKLALQADLLSSDAFLTKLVNDDILRAWNTINYLPENIRRDLGYLKLISDDENLFNICNLYKNKNRLSQYAELLEIDEALIYHYSKYSSQARAAGNDFYNVYRTKIDVALDKLPDNLDYVGISYSGLNLTNAKISEFINGNYIEFGDLISSSKLRNVGEDFLVKINGNVLIKIEGYSGKSIRILSSFPTEEEVLFSSISGFKVKGIPQTIPHPTKPNENVLFVTLEQQ